MRGAAAAVERERKIAGLGQGIDDALLVAWRIPFDPEGSDAVRRADRARVRRLKVGDIRNGWVPHMIRQVVPRERWREVARHELMVRANTTPGAVDELVRAATGSTNMTGWSNMVAKLLNFDDPATAKDWLLLAAGGV